MKIEKFNSSVLRKKCEEIGEITDEIKDIVVDMAQTMEKNQGIGLAAPQVGISKRIVVVQADWEGGRILALVNPKIIKRSQEKQITEEGCLSFPGIFIKIKRAKSVTVKGLNIKGEEIEFKADGIAATVFQHEIDHLNGTLFFQRLNFFKKILFKLKHPLLRVWI